jgi:hypothetical protein
MPEISAPQNTIVRLTVDDFTRLGLLTPEEIERQDDVHRAIAVENSDLPMTASIVESKKPWDTDGLKTKFSLLAESKSPDAITHELTLEASISNVKPVSGKASSFPSPMKAP